MDFFLNLSCFIYSEISLYLIKQVPNAQNVCVIIFGVVYILKAF